MPMACNFQKVETSLEHPFYTPKSALHHVSQQGFRIPHVPVFKS
jgi:hypothetical protein